MSLLYSPHWWCWAMPRGAWERGRCSRGPWRPPRGWVSGQTADTQTLLFGQTKRRGGETEREGDQEKEPNLRHGLDGRSVFEQELHHLRPVLLAGDVKRRETVLYTQTQTKGERVRSSVASRSHSGFVTGTPAFSRRVKGKRMIWQEMEGWSRGTSATDHKGERSLFSQPLLSKWSFFFFLSLSWFFSCCHIHNSINFFLPTHCTGRLALHL